jgi:hypothetical protein
MFEPKFPRMRTTLPTFRCAIAAVLLGSGVCALGQTQAGEDAQLKPEEANVRFRWALGAISPATRAAVALGEKPTLKSGDRIEVLVQTLTPCFVYVIAEDAAGTFNQWYPSRPRQQAVASTPAIMQVALDSRPGKERLHVLGSAQPLVALEGLLQEYKGAAAAAKLRLAGQVTAELKALREKALSKPSRVSEQVLFGKYRAEHATIESLAKEVSAKDLVVKNIVIDHQ